MSIKYNDDGVCIREEQDELLVYKCQGCGYTSRTALDGTGIIIPAREQDPNFERLLASGTHRSNIEARPAQYLIGLCGHNGSVVSELDGETWQEYITAHEDETIIVSDCCGAPCDIEKNEPEDGLRSNPEFEYFVSGTTICSDHYVKPLSVVRYKDMDGSVARVIDRVYYDGCGALMDGIVLRVLVLSENLHHAFIRYVRLDDITYVMRERPSLRTMLFMLAPTLPGAEVIEGMARAGELSDGYIDKALSARGLDTWVMGEDK